MDSSETFINHDIEYGLFFSLSSMIIHASVGVAFSVNSGAVEQLTCRSMISPLDL